MDFQFSLPRWRRKSAERGVAVLLASSVPSARKTLRQAVSRFIAADFVEVDSKAELHSAVTFDEFDLIVTESEINGGLCFDIVEQIRYGRLHCHAFPVIVILASHGADGQVDQDRECGADLVLNAGTAARTLPGQLDKLIQERRPFVVTPHYIGPDRRDACREAPTDMPHVSVPNPLAARLSGMAEADYRRQIALASHGVSLMRRALYFVRMNQTREVPIRATWDQIEPI